MQAPAVGRILRAAEAGEVEPSLIGGKAANLARLARTGVSVPPWAVATTAVFADARAGVEDALRTALADLDPRDQAAAEAASGRIRQAFGGAALAAADREALSEAARELAAGGALLAVRSSAVGEDAEGDSFAGQLDTFLHVPVERVVERVLDCFASAWSPRALLYRRVRGLEEAGVAVAVVVQRMIPARAAGVLFTADPTSGARGRAVVAAGLGLGEGVVADLVPSDTFTCDLASGRVLRRELATKDRRVVLDAEAGGGTRTEAAPPAEAAAPALSDAELAALTGVGRRLEAAFGAPQDVEWALDPAGALHVLQARPITTLPPERPSPEEPERIFDSANVVESYPGVTTPLTFSFARAVYEEVFRNGARRFGVPARVLAREGPLFGHMVAFVEGRIYYDILSWYRLYHLIPGFETRIRAWEEALGIAPGVGVEDVPAHGRLARLRTLAAAGRNLLTLERDVAAFARRVERAQEEERRRPSAGLSADALVRRYEALVRDLLAHGEVSIVNDFYTFLFFELLGKLIARWGLEGGSALRNELLCGEAGMRSVEPARSLLELAREVREEPGLGARFAATPDDDALWRELSRDPAAAGFVAACRRHVERYGDRTVHELKLETTGLEERPGALLGLVREHLGGRRSVADMEAREQAVRAAAEARVRAGLGRSPLRRRAFELALGRCRATVRQREDLRLLRSRSYGLAKRVFRALGQRLAEAAVLTAPDDVFFLTVDEVVGAVRGTGVTRDLTALVGLRRGELTEHLARVPPARVRLRGVAAAHRPAEDAAAADDAAARAGDVLSGQGCAPGRVRAPARVVRDPTAAAGVEGCVLVAEATDPGWVFLMVAAAGVVVERGSPLSHTAIIGRELGIPTVVAVAGATRRIRDGQPLELDGAAGTVRLLDEEG